MNSTIYAAQKNKISNVAFNSNLSQDPSADLVAYYCAFIRSSLDYARPVFFCTLPKYLQVELESGKKKALACILPGTCYTR